jgi:hypothetical protein
MQVVIFGCILSMAIARDFWIGERSSFSVPLESPSAKRICEGRTEAQLVFDYLGAPALFQSITLTRFQWLFLS